MRFWDSSAVVPLIVEEPQSAALRSVLSKDARVVHWWSLPVECGSALWRRHREGILGQRILERAMGDLDVFLEHADEIVPTESIRSKARRLLGRYPLR